MGAASTVAEIQASPLLVDICICRAAVYMDHILEGIYIHIMHLYLSHLLVIERDAITEYLFYVVGIMFQEICLAAYTCGG